MSAQRKRIRHVHLRSHKLHAAMDMIALGTFELTVSDAIAAIRTVVLFAESPAKARYQFDEWLTRNYPK